MKLIDKIPSWLIKVRWPFLIVGSMFLLAFLGYMFILFGGRFVVDERDLILPSTTSIVTEDGEVIGKLYEENRMPVEIEQIPDHVEEAFLAIEDQRFYDHAGISFLAVMRALYRDIIAMEKVEGGSTITQQLAKNLFLHNDKTWMRKTKEVMASIYLERNFSKQNILELYLNEIYFAHGIYGVGTAATFYFGKPVEELTIGEGALLAALSKAPNTYSPLNNPEKAKQRRDLVLQQMNKLGLIETNEMLQMQGKTLGLNQADTKIKPWLDDYIDVVIEEVQNTYQLTIEELRRGGYTIYVGMNKEAQKIAYEQFQQENNFYGSTEGVEGSFVLMNQYTGKLEAVIGGRNFTAGDLNRATVPRQPGSVMKPIAVYGPAMMLGDYEPYSLLSDESISFNGYTVSNADGKYDGSVSMYDAVKQSKNVPAVWLLNKIGISYSKSYLEQMDLHLPDKGLAIALGGLEEGVSPIALAESYRPFIHGGEWIQSYTIDKIEDRNGQLVGSANSETKQVFSPQVAWNMVRMLESVVSEGTGSAGEFNGALAGKTGSTQHPFVQGQIKDAWFVGFTPKYVTSLWMGYDQSDENHYLTKGSVAPTITTKKILHELGKKQELAKAFQVPDDVVDVPKPVQLPVITDLEAEYKVGGLSLVKGVLTWSTAEDERIIYQVYQQEDDGAELVGEVVGRGQYTVDRIQIFSESTYFIVPVNPLTKEKGEQSNTVEL